MLTLAQATRETRIALKLLVIAIVVGGILFFSFQGAGIIKRVFFPTPPAPPEVKYGELPPIVFPPNENAEGLTFRINTVSGILPTFSDQMTVYKTQSIPPNLLALQNARTALGNVGFNQNETRVQDNIYQWTQTGTGAVITYNILTKNFQINSSYLANPEIVAQSILPQKSVITQAVVNFLNNLGVDTTDIDTKMSDDTVSYFIVQNGTLVKVEQLHQANVATVDLIQTPLKEVPIYYPNPPSSTMRFVVAFFSNQAKILQADFLHIGIDTNESSTYPVITTDQAFKELEAGNAYISNGGTSPHVDITEASLGYYLGNESQQYVLPVYVFVGKGFTAYVNAISSTPVVSPATSQ